MIPAEPMSTTFPVINIMQWGLTWRHTPSRINSASVKYLIIHHAKAKSCTVAQIHDWHLARDNNTWAGAGYNYFVRKDGSIYEMRGTKYQGAHATGFNSISMGICLEGDYDTETPPDVQLEAVKNLCIYLMGRFPSLQYNYGRVITHNSTFESPSTAKSCPGKKFPIEDLKGRVRVGISAKNEIIAKTVPATYGVNNADVIVFVPEETMTIEQLAKATFNGESTLVSLNPELRGRTHVSAGMAVNIVNNPMHLFKETVEATTEWAGGLVGQAIHSFDSAASEGEVDKTFSSGTLTTVYGNVSDVFAQDQEALRYKAPMLEPSLTRFNGMSKKKFGHENETRGDIEYITSPTDYDKMKLYVETSDHVASFMFKVDPSSNMDTRSRKVSVIDTKGGSIIVDRGKNLGQKQISGQMLDYNGNSEKFEFIDFYEHYIESGNYKTVYLSFQGAVYLVELTNVSISDSSANNILKRYTLSFIIIAENRGTSNQMTYADAETSTTSKIGGAVRVHPGILNTLVKDLGVALS